MSNTQADIETELNSLWVHAQFGDNLSYRQLMSGFACVLRAFLVHMMPSHPDEVEDVLQACLLATHLKRHTYQGTGLITDWLCDICIFKCKLHQRQRGRYIRSLPSFDHWEDVTLHQHVHENHASKLDMGKLTRLFEPHQRTALELARLGDSSVLTKVSAQKNHDLHLHAALRTLYKHWRQ
jgi:DNA-directed RNA polymerase specialized sigma24 family protein